MNQYKLALKKLHRKANLFEVSNTQKFCENDEAKDIIEVAISKAERYDLLLEERFEKDNTYLHLYSNQDLLKLMKHTKDQQHILTTKKIIAIIDKISNDKRYQNKTPSEILKILKERLEKL